MRKNDWLKGLVLVAAFTLAISVIQPLSSKLFGLTVASQMASMGVSLGLAVIVVSYKTVKKTCSRISAVIKLKLTKTHHPRLAH